MNRLVWVMLVFLVVCTIAIGLISCGPKKSDEPNIPAISEESEDLTDYEDIEEDDEDEDEEEESEEEEKEETKLPTVHKPSSNTSTSTWTPPSYTPPAASTVVPDNTTPAVSGGHVTYDKAGTYSTAAEYKKVTIDEKGVILSNKTISGDLIITENVGSGDVHLSNIDIGGTLYIYGGGENSIYLDNVTVDKAVVNRGKKGRVRIIASGKTSVKLIEAYSGIILKETALNKNFDGFYDIVTKSGNKLSNLQVTLYGCDINEIKAHEDTTLSIKDGCEIKTANAEFYEIFVIGDWSAIDKRKGDVERNSTSSSGGGGSSKTRISTPKNLSYSVKNNRFYVSWDSVSKADNYTIRTNAKTHDVPYSSYTGADITDYIPTGKNNISIQIKANRSSSGYKDSNYSNTLSVNNVVKPDAVSNPKLSMDGTDLKVEWDAPVSTQYLDGYRVELVSKATGKVMATVTPDKNSTSTVFAVGSARSANAVSVSEALGATYYARVYSLPATASGEVGLEQYVLTNDCLYENTQKLAVPTGLAITYDNSTKQLKLTWDEVFAAAEYDVFKNGEFVATTAAASYTVTLDDSDLNGTASFAVQAIDAGQNSTYDSEKSAAVVLSRLTAPSGFTLADGKLTWNSVDGATAYEVSLNGGTAITVTNNQTSVNIVDANEYTYTVLAKANDKINSDTTQAVIKKLAAPVIQLSNDDTITWDKVDGASDYEVYKDDSKVNSPEISEQDGKFSFTATENGSYSVMAMGDSSLVVSSEKSNSVTVTIAQQLVIEDVVLAKEDSDWVFRITAPNAANVTVSGDITVTGSAPDFTAEIPEQKQSYTIVAVGDGKNYLKSAEKNITVTTAQPELLLNDNGEVTATHNADLYLNGNNQNSICLADMDDGSYTVKAVVEPIFSDFNLGGEATETYTVKTGNAPSEKPAVTADNACVTYTITLPAVENYTYGSSYTLNITNNDDSVDSVVISELTFEKTAIDKLNNAKSFTVSVQANCILQTVVSEDTVTKYPKTSVTLTSDPIVIESPSQVNEDLGNGEESEVPAEGEEPQPEEE
ncbi:MAG: hypothetical protein IKV41_07420 [Oscillospiraceae bacterium]|nr:hypothetical protein [Oscillospiraceae bacterium]